VIAPDTDGVTRAGWYLAAAYDSPGRSSAVGAFSQRCDSSDYARLTTVVTASTCSAEPLVKPSRQLGYRSCQPSWRLALAFEAPRRLRCGRATRRGRAYISELGHSRDGRQPLNYAIYHDCYQCTGEGWKFTERAYRVRYEDTTPLAGSPPRRAGLPTGPSAGNTPAAEGQR
jgi:hypothetical protein